MFTALLVVSILQGVFVSILWKLQGCACFAPGGCGYSRISMSRGDDGVKGCLYIGNALASVMVLTMLSLAIAMMIVICGSSGAFDDGSTLESTFEYKDGLDNEVGNEFYADDLFPDNNMECPFTDASFWKLYAGQVGTAAAYELIKMVVIFTGVISYLFCDCALCMKFFGGRRAELSQSSDEDSDDSESSP